MYYNEEKNGFKSYFLIVVFFCESSFLVVGEKFVCLVYKVLLILWYNLS